MFTPCLRANFHVELIGEVRTRWRGRFRWRGREYRPQRLALKDDPRDGAKDGADEGAAVTEVVRSEGYVAGLLQLADSFVDVSKRYCGTFGRPPRRLVGVPAPAGWRRAAQGSTGPRRKRGGDLFDRTHAPPVDGAPPPVTSSLRSASMLQLLARKLHVELKRKI